LPYAAYVRGSRIEAQLTDVLDRFQPPLAPYTRCPVCNGTLATVAKDEIATGSGVLREEPAIHFSGRADAGWSVRRVDLEGTVAGSRDLRVVAGRA
jgi:hypothetical protein